MLQQFKNISATMNTFFTLFLLAICLLVVCDKSKKTSAYQRRKWKP